MVQVGYKLSLRATVTFRLGLMQPIAFSAAFLRTALGLGANKLLYSLPIHLPRSLAETITYEQESDRVGEFFQWKSRLHVKYERF